MSNGLLPHQGPISETNGARPNLGIKSSHWVAPCGVVVGPAPGKSVASMDVAGAGELVPQSPSWAMLWVTEATKG